LSRTDGFSLADRDSTYILVDNLGGEREAIAWLQQEKKYS